MFLTLSYFFYFSKAVALLIQQSLKISAIVVRCKGIDLREEPRHEVLVVGLDHHMDRCRIGNIIRLLVITGGKYRGRRTELQGNPMLTPLVIAQRDLLAL